MKSMLSTRSQFRFVTSNLAATILLLAATAPLMYAQRPIASSRIFNPAVEAQLPYNVSQFAASVPGEYTQPDSIAFNSTAIYIGYGNNGDPGGGNSIPSTIVEYDFNGNILNKANIVGHNDGLKINPQTGALWAMENEDANARLLILDPQTLAVTQSFFLGTGPHGGGYDDIVFLNGNVYFSCSNPQHNPNNKPAIMQFTSSGNQFTLTPILLGNASAIDIPTGQQVTLNLQDPDSMTYNFGGDIVLDSQADGELVMVHNPGAGNQSVYRVLLTANGSGTTIDDTIFPTASAGFMLVADTGGDAVYKITAPYLQPGSAYSASDTEGFVGRLEAETGVLTPVVTGMVSAHGMAFLPQQ
jgi:hypothetical protein